MNTIKCKGQWGRHLPIGGCGCGTRSDGTREDELGLTRRMRKSRDCTQGCVILVGEDVVSAKYSCLRLAAFVYGSLHVHIAAMPLS